MALKEISNFSAVGETLTFDGRPLNVAVMGAPLRQFEFASGYLVVLPNDPYAGQLFDLRVITPRWKEVETHFAPERDASDSTPPQQRVHFDGQRLSLDLGAGEIWTVEALARPRYYPGETWKRLKSGWLPLFEWVGLIRPSYLRIRRATRP